MPLPLDAFDRWRCRPEAVLAGMQGLRMLARPLSDGTTEPTAAREALPGILDGPRAIDALAAAVARVAPARSPRRTLLRIEQRVEAVEPWGWVHAQAVRPRVVWIDRNGESGMVGVGTARQDEIGDVGHVDDLVASGRDTDLRWLTTVRFATAGKVDDAWQPFGRVRRMLPRIELRWQNGEQMLACHVHLGGDGDLACAAGALAALADASRTVPAPPGLHREANANATVHWSTAVQDMLARIECGELAKAVAARRVCARAAAALDPIEVLRMLHAAQPDTFALAIDHGEAGAFVAVSPELLFRRRGRDVDSEALAGTAPRGRVAADDAAHARALLASDKDRREHDLVVEHVVNRLAPLCDDVHAAAPELCRLRYAHHLRTPVQAQLRRGIGDGDLLAALHPTPATCGMPPGAAHAAITAAEGFDRGLYGGAIAWLGHDETTCAVALRAALLRGHDAMLFVGAGIVAGSDADAEWRETETKLAAFAPWLGGGAA